MQELIIKAEELQKFMSYVDELPHKIGKTIENFLQQVHAKRLEEQKAAQTEASTEDTSPTEKDETN